MTPTGTNLARWVTQSLIELFQTNDHREGVAAFMEKREPNYIGVVMQDRPTAAELLGDIAAFLEELVPQLSGPVQHQARVAANLARIVEREVGRGGAAVDRELAALRSLLGHDGTLQELNAELVDRLARHELHREALPVLLEVTRDKLAINKPGYAVVSIDVTVKGIAAFLTEQWQTPVEISDVTYASAGARRRNVLFTAHRGHEVVPLVATIIHDPGLQIMTVETEAATLLLAEAAGCAVPHVHAVCLDTGFVGGPFFVTSQIAGTTVGRQVLRLVDEHPGLGARIAHGIGSSLARLHATDPATAPVSLARPQTNPVDDAVVYVATQMDGLLQPSAPFALAYAWLDSHRPASERVAVVHRDCRNGNIIVGPDGLRAILDWEVAHIGEPMEDLAWTSVRMWRFGNDDLEIGGFATRDELRAGYEAGGGTWDEESYFWWQVYSALRWGLGLAGQGKAHLDGSFSSIVMAGSGRRVGELEYDLLMLLRDVV